MAKKGGASSGGGRGSGVFVGPHSGEGNWQVKRSGNQRASRVTDTQKEAIDIGRRYAQQHETELSVQRRNGTIREKKGYGDESPKKDKD